MTKSIRFLAAPPQCPVGTANLERNRYLGINITVPLTDVARKRMSRDPKHTLSFKVRFKLNCLPVGWRGRLIKSLDHVELLAAFTALSTPFEIYIGFE
jgi:hypothetical protein